MLTFSEISLSFRNERDEKKFPGIFKVWEYLANRGIDRKTAELCGLHIMQAVELIAAARRSPNVQAADNRAAIVFPHFRLGDRDDVLEWWSSRLVPLVEQSDLRLIASFGDLVDRQKMRTPGKMFCPPNEPPHGYFPPIYPWGSLQRDQRVYIHESAIKAINGAILGTASVGLNGVWGWSSKKHGISLIEELRDLPWKALNLQPVIVFDSNAWDNWQVQEAESRLAAKIYEITGRMAFSLRVPKPLGGDMGFDDFVQSVGPDQAKEFLEGAGEPIDINEIELMKIELNSQVCVVRSMGVIAEQATGTLMPAGVFTGVTYAHYTARIEDEQGRSREVNVPKLWLSDARKAQVERLEYMPGEDRLIRGDTGLPNLNTWPGMGRMPETGNVDPWLDLLVSNVNEDDIRQWLIAWCAYPLQNPGKKLNTYPLIFGPSGTGKNLFFKPFHAIYGLNASLISKEQIQSTFNSVYAQKQFVHIDELTRARGDGDDAVSQKIKMLTTSESLVVNTKGVKEYSVRNCANLVITSNYWDCIKLDQDDRRATVIRWDPTLGGMDHRGEQAYWVKYVKWCEAQGASALYQWLLDQDIRWFDPASWAPETPWKEMVKDASTSALVSWVRDLKTSPKDILPMGGNGKCLFSAKELCVMFLNVAENDISPHQVKVMSNELRNAGFMQAAKGALLRKPGGMASRFWVVDRTRDEWNLENSLNHLKRHK